MWRVSAIQNNLYYFNTVCQTNYMEILFYGIKKRSSPYVLCLIWFFSENKLQVEIWNYVLKENILTIKLIRHVQSQGTLGSREFCTIDFHSTYFFVGWMEIYKWHILDIWFSLIDQFHFYWSVLRLFDIPIAKKFYIVAKFCIECIFRSFLK